METNETSTCKSDKTNKSSNEQQDGAKSTFSSSEEIGHRAVANPAKSCATI